MNRTAFLNSDLEKQSKQARSSGGDESPYLYYKRRSDLEHTWLRLEIASKRLTKKEKLEALGRITVAEPDLDTIADAFEYQKQIPNKRTQVLEIAPSWLDWYEQNFPEMTLNAVRHGAANVRFMRQFARYYIMTHPEISVAPGYIRLDSALAVLSDGWTRVTSKAKTSHEPEKFPAIWLSRIFISYLTDEFDDIRGELEDDIRVLRKMALARRRTTS
jgi:hypothetical protein